MVESVRLELVAELSVGDKMDYDSFLLEDLVYAAATIDCEGCIGITSTQKRGVVNPSFVVRVSVTNTDFNLIDWLLDTFGGYYHPLPSKNPKHKDRYTWYIQHQGAVAFLALIQPYIKLKHKQVLIALEMQSLISEPFPYKLGIPADNLEKRLALKEAMSILNMKGPGNER